MEALDVLGISRSQKTKEYVDKVKIRLANQAEMANRKESEDTSSGYKRARKQDKVDL